MRRLIAILTVLLLFGCPTEIRTRSLDSTAPRAPDGAAPAADTGSDSPDGGVTAEDGGAPAPDSGFGEDAAGPRDSGPAPQDATAPSDAGQVDSGAHPDASVQTPDATSPADTGPSRPDGGLVPLTWGTMTLPANTRALNCVWGRGASEVYAGTGSGALLRFDGTSWAGIWQDPGNRSLTAISGTGTSMFVTSEAQLHVFGPGGTSSHLVPRVRSITDVFAFADDDVYLTAREQNTTVLLRFDGAALTEFYHPTGVGQLETVWGPTAGELYFAGSNGSLFSHRNGVTTPESIEWPASWGTSDIANMSFHAVRGFDGELFAAGSRHLIFKKGNDRVWRLVYSPFLTDNITAIAGTSAGAHTEAYAVGRSVTGGPVARFYEGAWTSQGVDRTYHLFDVWRAGPDDYFAAGMIRNTVQGALLRGFR